MQTVNWDSDKVFCVSACFCYCQTGSGSSTADFRLLEGESGGEGKEGEGGRGVVGGEIRGGGFAREEEGVDPKEPSNSARLLVEDGAPTAGWWRYCTASPSQRHMLSLYLLTCLSCQVRRRRSQQVKGNGLTSTDTLQSTRGQCSSRRTGQTARTRESEAVSQLWVFMLTICAKVYSLRTLNYDPCRSILNMWP